MRNTTAAASASILLAVGLLGPAQAGAADLLTSVDEAYASRQLRRTPFDPRTARDLPAEEARFLEALFSLTDEAVRLDTDARRWLASDGRRGLHVVGYVERIDGVRSRLARLETPPRVASVRALVEESLRLQRDFLAEWQEARAEGRPFASQLTDEVAYHEGLHRSHRLLLKAFAELRALFVDAEEAVHRSFHDHLRALDLQ